MSSSQKLNRIFSVDTMSRKFPVPSTEIILDIINKFSDVDLNWLIRGNTISKSYNTREENPEYCQDNIEDIIANKLAEKLFPRIYNLINEIEHLENEISLNRNK